MESFEVPDRMRHEMRRAWDEYLDRVKPLRPVLHRYCRRLTRDLWEADDLVQDTLIRGFGQLARHHDPIRNPRAYLLRCATHLWIDAQRRRAREREILSELPRDDSQPAPTQLSAGPDPAPHVRRRDGAAVTGPGSRPAWQSASTDSAR